MLELERTSLRELTDSDAVKSSWINVQNKDQQTAYIQKIEHGGKQYREFERRLTRLLMVLKVVFIQCMQTSASLFGVQLGA